MNDMKTDDPQIEDVSGGSVIINKHISFIGAEGITPIRPPTVFVTTLRTGEEGGCRIDPHVVSTAAVGEEFVSSPRFIPGNPFGCL